VIATDELDDADYRRNAANRCFFCKTELYGKMTSLARRRGFAVVWDGTNADDAADYRPGIAAADRQGVSSPLKEADLQKSEVRQLSRLAGLSTWDKPAAACLSSRVAYGLEVTPEVLARIEAGEEALRELGFRQIRRSCRAPSIRRWRNTSWSSSRASATSSSRSISRATGAAASTPSFGRPGVEAPPSAPIPGDGALSGHPSGAWCAAPRSASAAPWTAARSGSDRAPP
jgi:hypothetical protein